MHCELLVPGLLPPREAAAALLGVLRLPALELLLARGRAAGAAPEAPERWLSGRFGLEDAPLAAGALSALAGGIAPGEAAWARADPVHLELLRDRMRLVPGAALGVERAEADALCGALNRHFAGAPAFRPLAPALWCAELAPGATLEVASPLELAGADVAASLPGGPGASRWRALLNEIQMVLHEHPVNEARSARGALPVNSVWLWGAGALPSGARAAWHSVAAADPVALGLARLAGARQRALPAGADEWLGRAPEDGRHLVMLDLMRAPLACGDAPAWRAALEVLEARWFAPLLAALRAGRIGMITLHVPDAGRSFETIGADLRRFWRRARALGSHA